MKRFLQTVCRPKHTYKYVDLRVDSVSIHFYERTGKNDEEKKVTKNKMNDYRVSCMEINNKAKISERIFYGISVCVKNVCC